MRLRRPKQRSHFECVACSAGKMAIHRSDGFCWHTHEQQLVWINHGRDLINCDRGISWLVEVLNAAGMRTTNSCERDGDGFAYVSFEGRVVPPLALSLCPPDSIDQGTRVAIPPERLAEWLAAEHAKSPY